LTAAARPDGEPRTLLLDKAIAHAEEHGIGDTSLRGLANALGTSHRMLIYHFGSREGLLAAVVEETERRQREAFEALRVDPDVGITDMARHWSRGSSRWAGSTAPAGRQQPRPGLALDSASPRCGGCCSTCSRRAIAAASTVHSRSSSTSTSAPSPTLAELGNVSGTRPGHRGPRSDRGGEAMTGVNDMITAAKARIENLSPSDVAAELDRGEAVLVDVREPTETAQGVIGGALLAPRGMLEFHADPATPYHLDALTTAHRVILYCAAGSRSALAARTLQDFGFRDVAHLDGGYRAWVAEGRPVERPPA
jgi:rhodanese-related sulfurtransferase